MTTRISQRLIGGSLAGITRRAVSYTPTSATTLRQWTFTGVRVPNQSKHFDIAGRTYIDLTTMSWEIRADAGSGNKPVADATAALASGSFDFRYTSQWKLGRVIDFTVNLTSGLALTANTRYWFVLKVPGDEVHVAYPLAWMDTYESGEAEEVSATVYSSVYVAGSGWQDGTNTYNLSLTVQDAQAGEEWDVVIDGVGYMTPDHLRSYQVQTVSSGLAQSRGGQSEHSQMMFPYTSFSQDDWTGGGGQLDIEDMTKYLYALNLDTTVKGQAILGPMVHITGVETTNPEYMPTSPVARTLPDTENNVYPAINKYYAQKFTAPTGGMTASALGVWANKYPYAKKFAVSIALFSDVDGSPGENLTGWKLIGPLYKYRWWDIPIEETLTSETDYWVVIQTTQDSYTLPEYRVMFDGTGSAPGGAAKESVDGTTWTTLTGYSMAYRLNYGQAGSLHGTVTKFCYGSVNGTKGLFCLAGSKVYQWDETHGDWDDISTNISGSGVHTLSSPGTDLICYADKLYVAQGYDDPLRIWDGTTWEVAATGAELVLNGEFTTDTASWTATDATLSSEAGGEEGNGLKVLVNAAPAWAFASQAITVEADTWYEFSFWHKNGSGTAENHVKVGPTANSGTNYNGGALDEADWTEHTLLIQTGPSQTTLYITLLASDEAGAYGLFDKISLKKLLCGKLFYIAKGYLWMSSDVNKVVHNNTGVSSDWSAEATVGEDLYDITSFVMYNGKLLVGKENGIWDLTDNFLAKEYTRFDAHAAPNNCVGMCVWSGLLYIPVQNTIWRWGLSTYSDVGPSDQSNGPTASWPNKISYLYPSAPLLWASANPTVATGYGGLMAYNAGGWQYFATATRNNQANNVVFVTTEVGSEYRVWYGEGDRVSYIKLPTHTNNRYDWASADYDVTGGAMVTSWWDGGVKDALKFWNRATFLADLGANSSIEVYAAVDGEDWNTTDSLYWLGELRAGDKDENGEYALQFPDGLVAKSIQLIFNFYTQSSSETPRLRAYNMECIIRQIPSYAHTFAIQCSDNVLKTNGETDTRTGNTIWESLRRTADKSAPVIFSFPSFSFRGMISDLKRVTAMRKADGTLKTSWDTYAHLSVIEAN
jgi:hypothetical protein